MARKNIQDDGSYQKSQKLGNSKGKFDKKEEEWEPPIRSQVFYDDISYEDPSYEVGYQPLDANGQPVFGMVPFRGEAEDMLSKANRKKELIRSIEELKSKDRTDKPIKETELNRSNKKNKRDKK